MTATPHVLPSNTLVGDRVRNAEGEDLGTIEELMIDLHSGRIVYVVLSFGGILGIGDKLFAIPWSALSLDPDDNQIVLNVKRASLENAPGLDKEQWPSMADRDWGVEIYNHYGYTPLLARESAEVSVTQGSSTSRDKRATDTSRGAYDSTRQRGIRDRRH